MTDRKSVQAMLRDPRLLGRLNVAAVGLSLASLVGVVFGVMFGNSSADGGIAMITAIPSLLVGSLWAALLRWKATFSKHRIRWGWLLSVPLAALNASLAGAALLGSSEREPLAWAGGAVLGATFGVIFWLPAMLLVLLFFGVPIARANRLAEQGLAGQEQGERVVGMLTSVLGALGAGLALLPRWGEHGSKIRALGSIDAGQAGMLLVVLCGGLAVLLGGAAAALARQRERRRRAFVEAVEKGEVAGYRVEAAGEGKVLLRVSLPDEGYRVAEEHEALLALDHDGAAKQALVREDG